jgi:hypothetical protein
MKAPNYGKSWRLKPLERTQQNAHGIKLKATVIDGAKWPRSWQRSLDGGGGGDRVHKPSTTCAVLNGVYGCGKRAVLRLFQKGGFLERLYQHELC